MRAPKNAHARKLVRPRYDCDGNPMTRSNMKILAPLCLGAIVSLAGTLPACAEQFVPVAPFDSVELAGGGHVLLVSGNVQKVRLTHGSLAYTRFVEDGPRKLRIEACNRDCPPDYDLQVEITTPQVTGLAISGGGAIDSDGNFAPVRHLAVAIDGGGRIDARALDANTAEAAVNGGGVIRLKADARLTAAVDGGGEIRYWGNPRVTQAIDGGGQIERGN